MPSLILWLSLAVVAVGCIVVWLLHSIVYPRIEPGATYRADSGSPQSVDVPFELLNQPEGTFFATFDIWVTPLTAHRYAISADDCLDSITINGKRFDDDRFAYCDFRNIRTFDLSSLLTIGLNHIAVTAHNTGGAASVRFLPAQSDSRVLLWILVLLAVMWMAMRTVLCRLWKDVDTPTSIVLFFGVCLRLLYVFATPYTTRAHDADAHIEYIHAVAQTLRIPAASGGWEFHQAPLYYLLSGLYERMGNLWGLSRDAILQHLQYGSLVASIATFFAAFVVSLLLFPKKADRNQRLLFLSIVSAFPSLVFVSSRLYNDALYNFFAFAAVALLLWWWQHPCWRRWIMFSVTVALGYITKLSAMFFVPVGFVCLLVKRKMTWRSKAGHALAMVVIFVVLAGWLPYLRFVVEQDTTRSRTLGNDGMSSGLSVENNVPNYLIFNPIKVIEHPFNNPWTDEERRQWFPEYFYRSSFFGEFSFDRLRLLCQGMLLTGMLVLPLLLLGFLASIRWREWPLSLPVTILFPTLLAASAWYRFNFPYAPNQDFRFVVLLVLPIAFCIVRGIVCLPRSIRWFGYWLALLNISLSATFLLSIFLQS